MDLASLKTRSVKLAIEFDGETINLEILPHKLTPEYRSQLAKLSREQADENAKDADAAMIAELLSSWDVVNEGEPFPPTYDNLRLVPMTLLVCVATEMLETVGKLAAPKPRSK